MTRTAVMLLAASAAWAEVRLLVTVVEPRTGKPVPGITAADLAVIDGGSERKVAGVHFQTTPVDSLILIDSSAVGRDLQGIAADMIGQLREKEQMALARYDSSAELVQDFTSLQQTLLRQLAGIKFGNTPRVLDALYAVAGGGFEHATLRRVILVVTSGLDGGSGTSERDVIRLARKNGISIYSLYMTGGERGMFENLGRQTGGATISVRELSKTAKKPAEQVFDAIRSNYSVTIAGNLAPTDRMKMEVRKPGKYFVFWLVLD